MTKKSDAPAIRFKGFSDAWEQRKAIDIADYSKGNGYSKGDLTDAGTPIILYGRLYTKYQFAISEVDTFAVPRNGAVYSQGNEVIVPASGETAEDIARASAVEKSGVLLGGDLNILRPFDFINPLFLALAISNGEPQKELAKKAQGKSVVHIHNTDIQEVTIVYPSRTEQDRIVSVFRQLDHLITLHQRQPFLHSPPDISLIVQLTPPFYTFSWEQRKAIDIADYSKGNGYSKGDLTDAGTPIILYGRLYTKYQFAISEVDTFAVPRNGAVYSQGNEVIVPASGETAEDIARASAVEKSGVLLGGDLNILRPFDFINPLFLALAISNGEPQKELAKKAQGKSVVHIHNTDIQEVTIVYPSRTEQDRIVSVFRQLDHLITLHQRQPFLHSPPDISLIVQLTPPFYTFSWEQRKLTEFVESFSGLTYTPNDVQENGTLVLRSSNVSNGEVVDADNVYVNPQVVNSENVKVGDIVVVVRNGSRSLIGKHAQIKAFMPNTVIGAFMTGIRSECPEFTNALLNTSRFEEEIAMNMGATINQITGYMFSKMEFKVPCLDEQKKIGEYFEKLDRLITLHQRQTIVYAVIRSIRKVILAERQYFAPPMVRKSP